MNIGAGSATSRLSDSNQCRRRRRVPTIQIGTRYQRGSDYAIRNITTRCGNGKIARKTSKSELLFWAPVSRQTASPSCMETKAGRTA